MKKLSIAAMLAFCVLSGCASLNRPESLRIEGMEIVSLKNDGFISRLVAVGKGGISEPDRWFILSDSGDAEEVEPPARFFARFNGMSASADGRFLAIQSSGEGDPAIDVIDLPHFIKTRQTRSVVSMTTHPGSLSIDHWEDGRLYFNSDMLCLPTADSRRDPDSGYWDFRIELPESETFVFNPDTGEIKAVADELKDPVTFFGDILLDSDRDPLQREIGAVGLRRLGDKNGVPFLKRAVKNETDKDQIEWLKKTIEYLENKL